MANDTERTQPPTPRRRAEARKQGNLWQPREIGPAAAVATAALGFGFAGSQLWGGLTRYLAQTLDAAAAQPDDSLPVATLTARLPLAVPLALALVMALLVIGPSIAASRHASLDRLAPKFARISPAAGLARLVSPAALFGALTALLKLAAVAALALLVMVPLLPQLAHIAEGVAGLAVVGAAAARLFGAAALLLLIIALLDAGISFALRERKLMMSRDEIKREARQNDGAPEIKAAIRRAQFAAATRRLKTTMHDAAVVVVNPVHFAVAMRYDPARDGAPVVVEKGRLDAAAAIIATARELAIPVVRSPRLARALYFTARPGLAVREELFAAVATILAFVMRFEGREAPPPVFVPPDFDFDEQGARRKPGAALPL